jgi:hypothetical protein
MQNYVNYIINELNPGDKWAKNFTHWPIAFEYRDFLSVPDRVTCIHYWGTSRLINMHGTWTDYRSIQPQKACTNIITVRQVECFNLQLDTCGNEHYIRTERTTFLKTCTWYITLCCVRNSHNCNIWLSEDVSDAVSLIAYVCANLWQNQLRE